MNGKLEWFAGNEDALALYRMFVDVAHVWDDLVDRDKVVPEEDINRVFLMCLAAIPANPVYQRMFAQLHPLLVTATIGYTVANKYEKAKDLHGMEIGHTLRYSVAQAFVYVIVQLNGPERAIEILPEALKEMMPERIEHYLEEHRDAA
jgi:hypothetical protein